MDTLNPKILGSWRPWLQSTWRTMLTKGLRRATELFYHGLWVRSLASAGVDLHIVGSPLPYKLIGSFTPWRLLSTLNPSRRHTLSKGINIRLLGDEYLACSIKENLLQTQTLNRYNCIREVVCPDSRIGIKRRREIRRHAKNVGVECPLNSGQVLKHSKKWMLKWSTSYVMLGELVEYAGLYIG